MRNILVTGGAGFIGSHTCLILLEKGYDVFIIDSFVNSSPIVLERIPDLINKNQNCINENLKIFNGDLRKISDIKK